MKVRVLIVEDDMDLGHLLKQYLEFNNFDVTRVFNGVEARKAVANNVFDILILDVMMPKEDGFVLADKISQSHPDIPFLFVTARKNKEDILFGLKLGADDYIIKPFDVDVLILRIQNILKRTTKRTESILENIQIGLYHFQPKSLLLTSAESKVTLTEKESKLLHYLYANKERLITRDEILTFMWPDTSYFSGRSMDVFITRLRKHLIGDPEIHIESIRGMGFNFIVPSKS